MSKTEKRTQKTGSAGSPRQDQINHLPLPAIIWNDRLEIAGWSRQAYELFGWQDAETRGVDATGFKGIIGTDKARFEKVLQKALAGDGQSVHYKFRARNRQGHEFLTEWFLSCHDNRAARRKELIALVRRVEERIVPGIVRQSSEPALAVSDESIYQTLFESTPENYVVVEPNEYRIVTMSRTYYNLLAYLSPVDIDTVINRPLLEVLPQLSPEETALRDKLILDSFEQVKLRREKHTLPMQKTANNHEDLGLKDYRYWSAVSLPVLDRNKEVSYIIHRLDDITELMNTEFPSDREVGGAPGDTGVDDDYSNELMLKSTKLKNLHQELEEHQKRLETLFSNAPNGIIVLDRDGSFTAESNRVYCFMVGYTAAELQTLSLSDLAHPDDRDNTLDAMASLLDGSKRFTRFENRYITSHGDTIWCRISLSPLLDQDSRISNLIGIVEDITEQKHTELKLKRNEALTNIGGRLAKVGGWVVDNTQNATMYWSQQTYEIWGCDPGNIPTHDYLLSRIKPDYLALHDRETDRLRQGECIEYEMEIIDGNNVEKWLRVSGEPNLDGEGNIINFYGSLQDITETKKAEMQSHELNERLHLTLESMPDAFILFDSDWQIAFMNAEAKRLLRHDREASGNNTGVDTAPLINQAPIYKGCQEAMVNNQPFQCEYYSEFLNDWIEVNAFPTTQGLAVYFRSITHQKLLSRAIQESEQRLQYITRVTLDLAWERDLLKRRMWLSKAFESGMETLDTDTGDIIAAFDAWEDRIHPADRVYVLESLDSAISSSSDSWYAEYRFLNHDQHYANVEDRGFIIRNPQGKAVKMLGGMTDITEKLELQEQLQQAQRMESVGKLTGGIAHDFNNLLTVILGNAELLKDSLQKDSRLLEQANMIGNAALRGAELTQRLLAFARKQALAPEPTNVNRLINDMEGMLRRTLSENIAIHFQYADTLDTALVDANQLENALLNLCLNARDAMPGGGRLTIDTANIHLDREFVSQVRELEAGNFVMITVTDTGIGIPPELLDHVFEPFFTTKERDKGTGLGLSMIFGFIKQSNGHIDIRSEVGKGTVITMYLPVSQEKTETRERERIREIRKGTETILLVEDDDLVRSFARDLLNALGYRVLEASHGAQALDIIRQETPIDLLFTDVIMPGGMDGATLGEKVKILAPDIKILYTSGYAEDTVETADLLRTDVNLLQKPYQLESLSRMIRQVLENT